MWAHIFIIEMLFWDSRTDHWGWWVRWSLVKDLNFKFIFDFSAYWLRTHDRSIYNTNSQWGFGHWSCELWTNHIKVLNQNWIWFNRFWISRSKNDSLRVIFERGQIPSAFRTRILERNTSNDANIIYGNYIWDIRILDSWIYVPLLGCGNVFSFDDVNK